MKVTIIHKEECPTGALAIREFTEDGHEVEMYHDLGEIADIDRRCDMMADILSAGGDKDACPNVFVYDRYIPWQPKKGANNG